MEQARIQSAPQADQIALTAFKRLLYHRYLHSDHLERLDTLLTSVARYVETGGREGIGRAIIAMPPRHGKSLTTSRLFPAWFIGRNPEKRVMLVSYGASLAQKHSRHVRNLIRSERYQQKFPGVGLASDSQAADAWDVSGHEGGMDAFGIGGAATGKGAHCFPSGTMVMTEVGEIDIAELCAMSDKPRVKAYNHREGCTVWATIEAQSVIQSSELIEVTTTGGRRFMTTPEHPVFVDGRGYMPAERLTVGDTLKASTQAHSHLRVLRHNIPAFRLSAAQSRRSELRRRLLLERMQSGASCRQARASLCLLQQGHAGEAKQQVLLDSMSSSSAFEQGGNNLPAVQQVVYPALKPNAVLLKNLCKQGALAPYAWRWQLAFQGRNQLCAVVFGDAPADFGARPSCMCRLRVDRTDGQSDVERSTCPPQQPCHSSHQRKPDRQYVGQSGHDVQVLPCDTPQVEDDTVSRLRRIRTASQPVYDLQVAGCHNFFAEGVLVHNCLIIDDPIKNREQAESKLWRDKVWDSYTDDLYTRLEPGAAIIVMSTRWHGDDLTGRLLKTSPDDWTTLTLPAIGDDGAALWPARYPLPVLRKIETTLGPYSWASEFQQKPMPAEGGLFKRAWFAQIHDTHPPLVYKVRFWDLAMSEKTSADYTVGTLYGVDENGHRWILDVSRGQVDWDNLVDKMSAVMRADGPQVAQGIEQKGYMSRAVQALNRDLPDYAIFGYPKDVDKVTNALPFAAKCGAGLVHLLNRHWTSAWIDEVCSFPQAAHDDQVDSAAGAEGMIADGVGAAVGALNYAVESSFSESPY